MYRILFCDRKLKVPGFFSHIQTPSHHQGNFLPAMLLLQHSLSFGHFSNYCAGHQNFHLPSGSKSCPPTLCPLIDDIISKSVETSLVSSVHKTTGFAHHELMNITKNFLIAAHSGHISILIILYHLAKFPVSSSLTAHLCWPHWSSTLLVSASPCCQYTQSYLLRVLFFLQSTKDLCWDPFFSLFTGSSLARSSTTMG